MHDDAQSPGLYLVKKIARVTHGHGLAMYSRTPFRCNSLERLKPSAKWAVMHDAVDWKSIEENPFLKVKTQKSSVKVNEFVPREAFEIFGDKSEYVVAAPQY
jgi:hypothetical protein